MEEELLMLRQRQQVEVGALARDYNVKCESEIRRLEMVN
jgi:hypothetical protein